METDVATQEQSIYNDEFTKFAYFDVIGYKPNAGQLEVHQSNARFKVWVAGRRLGKSVGDAREVEPLILREGTTGWIVGPEYSACEKDFRQIWYSLIDKQQWPATRKYYNVKAGQMEIHFPWSPSQVPSVICKSERYASSLVGEGLDWALIVEAAKMKKETWTQLIRPALADKQGIAIFSTTPEGENWIYELAEDCKRKDGWEFFQHPSWLNNFIFPGGRNDPEIKSLEDDLTSYMFMQEVEAKFTSYTGQVYKEFEPLKHVVSHKYDAQLPTFAFLDFGISNPCAILWAQIKGNSIYVFDEMISSDMHSAMVKAVVRRYPTLVIFADPAGNQKTMVSGTSIVSELRKKDPDGKLGLTVVTPVARVIDRLNVVKLLLGKNKEEPHLFFDKDRTLLTQAAFRGYRYPARRSEVGEAPELPYKDGIHEHPMDALGYGCLGLKNVIEVGYSTGKVGAEVVG